MVLRLAFSALATNLRKHCSAECHRIPKQHSCLPSSIGSGLLRAFMSQGKEDLPKLSAVWYSGTRCPQDLARPQSKPKLCFRRVASWSGLDASQDSPRHRHSTSGPRRGGRWSLSNAGEDLRAAWVKWARRKHRAPTATPVCCLGAAAALWSHLLT